MKWFIWFNGVQYISEFSGIVNWACHEMSAGKWGSAVSYTHLDVYKRQYIYHVMIYVNYWEGRDYALFHIIIIYAPLLFKLNYLAMPMFNGLIIMIGGFGSELLLIIKHRCV